MLIGTQPPLGLEPVLVGPPFRSAALFPKPIGEFLLFPYVDLLAHVSSPSVFLDPRSNWKTPFERMIARMHGLCQPASAACGAAYETKGAAINASSDNAVKAAPVAWINAR